MERLNGSKKIGILWLLFLSLSVVPLSYMGGTAAELKASGNTPKAASYVKQVPNLLKGRTAPGFSLESLTGEKYDFSSAKGKVVLLDFWHTY